jgi:hypothetical protein
MIIDIKKTFGIATLGRKIEYQLLKIEQGNGKELYSSLGDSLNNVGETMQQIAGMNTRVKNPYVEFIISLPDNEQLTEEQFIALSCEYMEKMGYSDSCFSVIINNDTENKHVHILATVVDINGHKISDSMNYKRSDMIARNLEQKYDLSHVVKKGFSKTTLGEAQARKYYFDSALKKSFKSYDTKDVIAKLLSESEMFIKLNVNVNKSSFSNDEWKMILGSDLFERIGNVLIDKKFFNSLFKNELVNKMDEFYATVNNAAEFRDKLTKEGYYMRLVSDRGKSHYVFGIPSQNFYVKDSALPQKYRYGSIAFIGHRMNEDEQKHYLYGQLFSFLNKSNSYIDFKNCLLDNNIQIIEHKNMSGIYGLSFSIMNVDNAEVFKSSDISRRLTFHNIQNFFSSRTGEIEPIATIMGNEKWNNEVNYMFGAALLNIGSSKRSRTEEEEITKKRKKKKQQRSM